jgi:hypothetical protein
LTIKVIEIFDELKSLIDDCIDDYKDLENPILIADNAMSLWDKAFGLNFTEGTNLELIVCPKMTCQQNFELGIVNKLNTTQHNVDKRDDQMKSIICDTWAVKKCVLGCPTLNGKATSVKWTTHGGIGFIDSDRGKYIFTVSTIEVIFFDEL